MPGNHGTSIRIPNPNLGSVGGPYLSSSFRQREIELQRMIHYPRVHIEFCTKCKWNLRAAWYLQELLSTFGPELGEVAMAPADSGVFRVWIQVNEKAADQLLWDRKTQGFPDSKELKQVVRDVINPTRDLGHSDRKHAATKDTETTPRATNAKAEDPSLDNETEEVCVDCERPE